MTEAAPAVIRSTDNPQFRSLRLLAQDNTAWRKQGRVWLEGDHLARAALARGVRPLLAVYAESCRERLDSPARVLVLADPLFRALSGLESPAAMAFVIPVPEPRAVDAHAPTVVLDRVQDAGNVGAILRSAAAFGFTQVVALKGSASLWSPKVVRAGMGAHFALALHDAALPEALDSLKVPLLATSSHAGDLLHRAALPWPCAWLLGHEGQGVSPDVAARAAMSVRIAQPGGEESLNVAAAAAICLHASAAARAG
ncbi:TrmH family RNA methyltransferase [Ramlibacter humi]|uniref:RNA methyltransferase n=1 Tax=Ramlibacter humi TaxID=2530451 RepID=A0A4Z0C9K7_9BURK|nr:RNA methyltransferase [Ramlibacter humi]TFZ08021.1 RNA methyltransferase [Ramlibacter humi]